MYQDAVSDGIRCEREKGTAAMTVYYPRCCECGEEVKTYAYKTGVKYTCKACKTEKYLSDKQQTSINDYDKKEKKFETALSRIYKQAKSAEYDKAVKVIHSKLHKNGWFESTEEIMVAIELVRNGINARHQVKLGRYRADFVLEDEKIVLEVDGIIYHTKETQKREQLRDALIIAALGPQWDVIRITDEMINTNITKLLPAIKAVTERRKLLREHNGHELPDWYNKKTS